jgi:hypothetical protein
MRIPARLRKLLARAMRRFVEERERLRGYPQLKAKFLEKVGYPLDLRDPQTFNAKIQARKVFDRNPLFPIVSDKLRVREYVATVLGQAEADALFPRVLGVTQKPTAGWLREFGTGVVVKPNHGSQMKKIILSDQAVNYVHLSRRCRDWLATDYGRDHVEWAYRPIPRRILVEELLPFRNGNPADDLKFAVFDGVVQMAQLNNNKFHDHKNAFVTRDWMPLPIRRAREVLPVLPERPAGFDRMVAIAERLGQAFDYVRVDFLLTDQRFALSELTLYSGSGFTPFTPPEYDLILGQVWNQRFHK